MSRNTGQQIYMRRRMDVQIKIRGAQPDLIGRGQGKGGLTQLKRINAQKKMVHDRIADKHHVHNQLLVDLGFRCDLCEQPVHALAHGVGHFLGTRRVHHRIADPAHQVFAKPDLRVHHAG